MLLFVIGETYIVSLCYVDLLFQRADFSLGLTFQESDSQREVEGEVGMTGRGCV